MSTLIVVSARAQAVDCPAVAGRVSGGTSSIDALVLVMKCPAERAGALASWITVRKAETDTALLLEGYWGVNRVRSPQTFEALMRIAAGSGASEQSRVLSLWSLMFVEHGSSSQTYADMATLPLDGVCSVGGMLRWEEKVSVDGPIPADHRQRALALASGLIRDIAVPRAVQSAARCLATTLVDDLTVLPPPGSVVMPPPRPVAKLPGNITMGSLCGDRYYIRDANPGIDTVTLKYKGTQFQFDLVLAGPTFGLPYTETSFHSLKPDKTILLFYHGDQIASAHAHQTTPCTD
jgi:hypothetical protein